MPQTYALHMRHAASRLYANIRCGVTHTPAVALHAHMPCTSRTLHLRQARQRCIKAQGKASAASRHKARQRCVKAQGKASRHKAKQRCVKPLEVCKATRSSA